MFENRKGEAIALVLFALSVIGNGYALIVGPLPIAYVSMPILLLSFMYIVAVYRLRSKKMALALENKKDRSTQKRHNTNKR